jgi:hypothetical protein
VVLMAAGLIALAGCGGKEAKNSAEPQASASAGSWNAANACTLVDRKIVAEAAGVGVTDAKLGTTVAGGDGLATFSTCDFTLADSGTISVLTRRSPTPDYSREAVEKARTMGGNLPAATDVPGLGRAALWTRETRSLQVFIDDSRYLTITVVTPQSAKDPLEIAKAVAANLV